LKTIEYESAYGRRDPAKRGPKGKESGLVCILKLSGKKTAIGKFSGETPVG